MQKVSWSLAEIEVLQVWFCFFIFHGHSLILKSQLSYKLQANNSVSVNLLSYLFISSKTVHNSLVLYPSNKFPLVGCQGRTMVVLQHQS